MADLPLFYKEIVPLNKDTHAKHRIKAAEKPMAFAAETHLIPAVINEFTFAARHFPIVFVPTGTGYTSVFLCGLEPGTNALVDADGNWAAAYVPAYARRYPFMLGEVSGQDPIVCVDKEFAGFAEDNDGEALFDEQGESTEFLTGLVGLVTEYAQSANRTDSVCKMLAELNLFRSITVSINVADGARVAVHGLFMIDEEKLNGLNAEDFQRLRETGALGAIYAHLFSVGSTQLLSERLSAQKPSLEAAVNEAESELSQQSEQGEEGTLEAPNGGPLANGSGAAGSDPAV